MKKKPSPIKRADGTELRVPLKDFQIQEQNAEPEIDEVEARLLAQQAEQYLKAEYAKRGSKLGGKEFSEFSSAFIYLHKKFVSILAP